MMLQYGWGQRMALGYSFDVSDGRPKVPFAFSTLCSVPAWREGFVQQGSSKANDAEGQKRRVYDRLIDNGNQKLWIASPVQSFSLPMLPTHRA